MNERERRIARARLLRREGKTYDEIRAVIGPADDRTLQAWCKGIPRPPETLRGRAKDDLRRECRRLRGLGLTYDEISEQTGASKGSISPWVSDVVMSMSADARRRARNLDARARHGAMLSDRARQRREDQRRLAADAVGDVTHRDLFIAGVALYWAEGSKDKPWRRSGRTVLINSDPTVLSTYLARLDLVGLSEQDRHYRLSIHRDADVAAAELWWAERLRIPLSSFARASLKLHNPKTIRRNVGVEYHGCLVVSVARSSSLHYAIEGWWRALVCGVEQGVDGAHWERKWSPVG